MSVPTLRVGMPDWTLCVRAWNAQRRNEHHGSNPIPRKITLVTV